MYTDNSFDALYCKYSPRLVAYISRFSDPWTAEDLVHDTFIRYWTSYHGISDEKEVSRLLYTIVRNLCISQHRLRSCTMRVSIDSVPRRSEEFTAPDSDQLCSYNDIKGQLDSALSRLPRRSRQIFIKSRIEKMRYSDIAEDMGISVSAVEKHISKALKSLKAAINTE